MNMKRIGCVAAILLFSAVGQALAANGGDGLAGLLRQVVEDNLAAYNREDVPAALNSIHTKSPEYSPTEAALQGQFEALDARADLVDFRYIGHDDEFAVARVKIRTVERSDESFSANVLDTITVFHQEDGVWKFWSDHVLGVELVQ